MELAEYLLKAAGYDPPRLTMAQGCKIAERRPTGGVRSADAGAGWFEVLQHLRAASHDGISSSGCHRAIHAHRQGQGAGGRFNGYLSKPIDPETFVMQIEAYLQPDGRAVLHGANVVMARYWLLTIGPNRQLLLTLLGYAGHDLIELPMAWRPAASAAHRPDLVITDILMPIMSGYEFVQRVRADASLQHMPVIFYTASYSEPQAAKLAEACDVRIVLPKPCDPERVLGAVNEACNWI
jgi:CheY-like chemotaxis protein